MTEPLCRAYIAEVEGGYLVSKWTPVSFRDVKVTMLGTAVRVAAAHLKYCERFQQLREERVNQMEDKKSIKITLEHGNVYKLVTFNDRGHVVDTKVSASIDNALDAGKAFLEETWIDVTAQCKPTEGEIAGFPAIWYKYHGRDITPGDFKVKHGRILMRRR